MLATMAQRGLACHCIRCREVKDESVATSELALLERWYAASGGEECFLSFKRVPAGDG